MAKNMYMIPRPAANAPAVFNQTQVPLFRGWNAIPLMSFSLGSTNPVTIGSTTGGVGAGKINFSPCVLTKPADMNSAVFLRYCATGAHFDRVALYVTDTSGPSEIVTQVYALGLVFVASIVNDIASGDDAVTETISLAYGQLQQRVITFSSTGLRTGFFENTWDLTTNGLWTPGTLDGPG